MQLTNLLAAVANQLTFKMPVGMPDPDIQHITHDSRQVKAGTLFVARKGDSVDGHRYIENAINAGAVAVVGELKAAEVATTSDVPYLQIDDAKPALAWLAAALHGFPARQLVMIGVTGTDGKTTTSNLIHSVLKAGGLKTGLVSTVNAVIGDTEQDTGLHVTTPDAHEVQGYLAQMVDAGLTHCVLEVTSHGLAQHRVTACEFDIGVVTNITHEHLDYHGSREAYFDAKAMLFEGLSESYRKPGVRKLALLNRDDSSYQELRDRTDVEVIGYGLSEVARLHARNAKFTAAGTEFDVTLNGAWAAFSTKLIGLFNVNNCLAAIGVGLAQRLSIETIQAGISALEGIPGRMQLFNEGQEFISIVDFAHTPKSLEAILKTAQNLTQGKVIVTFGSAGLRDVEKRRWMAEVAASHADFTVLTAEDPRTESLDGILADMAAGCTRMGGREGETFWRVPDRFAAIRHAVGLAQAGDVVLACGKAHEQSMCFGTTEYPWDDRIAMQAALCERMGKPAPEVPKLPTSSE